MYYGIPCLWTGKESSDESNEKMLRKADAAWRELLAEEESVEVDPLFAREIDRIVGTARDEFLN